MDDVLPLEMVNYFSSGVLSEIDRFSLFFPYVMAWLIP